MMNMDLTIIESQQIASLEKIIESGLRTFAEVGSALMEIRNGRLYRASHGTFEAYCRERWRFARNYANKMIAAAAVVENLGTTVPKPTTEAQARPLAQLKPEDQPQAWNEANEKAKSEGRSVTAMDVEEAVKNKTSTKKPETENEVMQQKRLKSEENPYSTVAMGFAQDSIRHLQRIPKNDPNRSAAMQLVATWIKENSKKRGIK